MKPRGNSAETSFKIVLQCFRWSDEWIRLRQVLRLSSNILVEMMKNFVSNKFWNCLTMFSLKWWGISAETSFESVLQYFVEVMKKSSWDVFWNCLTMFSLKRWRKSAETSIEIVLDNFRWSDEEIRLKQVLKLSDNIFFEVMKKSG